MLQPQDNSGSRWTQRYAGYCIGFIVTCLMMNASCRMTPASGDEIASTDSQAVSSENEAGSTENQRALADDRPSMLKITPSVVDFGELWSGEKAEAYVAVTNEAPFPVSVQRTCGCSCGAQCPRLEPGETWIDHLSYNTLRRVGTIKQTMYYRATPLESDSPARD